MSHLVHAEAMHAAIVADALRVPWVPCRMYPQVNIFKWTDWTLSLGLEYQPHNIQPLYSDEQVRNKIEKKLAGSPLSIGSRPAAWAYRTRQRVAHERAAITRFLELKRARPLLSNDTVLEMRLEQLGERLEDFKKRYLVAGGF